MKRGLIILLTFALCCAYSNVQAQSLDQDDTLTIGSVDIWNNDARAWLIGLNKLSESYSWENCREALAQMINDCEYDIFGVQGLDQLGRDDIPRLLKKLNKNYKWWWCIADPYTTTDQARATANAIVYRKDRFKLSKKYSFWLSETPDQLSSGWGEGRFVRIAICTEVLDKFTGKRFFMMNTAFSGRKATNDKCGDLIVEREKMYNKEELVSILLGNLARDPNSVAMQKLSSYYDDSFEITTNDKSNITGTDLTASIKVGNLKSAKSRNCYVYTRSGRSNNCEVLSYDLNSKKYTNKLGEKVYPSRFIPVVVKVRIE